jgi:septal ring factor EnvC (AmiA/AmiB activator)
VSLHLPGRREKPKRKHRADDRIAELREQHAADMALLREENVLLHKRLAGADDYFMIHDQRMKELEAEVERRTGELAEEKETRQAIEKDRDAVERWVDYLEARLTDLEHRLDVGVKAEHVIARTQEIPAITRVLPLHQSPQADH